MLLLRIGRFHCKSALVWQEAGQQRTRPCGYPIADWRHNGLLRAYREALLTAAKGRAGVIDLLPQLELVQELTMDGCHYGRPASRLLAAATLRASADSLVAPASTKYGRPWTAANPWVPPIVATAPVYHETGETVEHGGT